MTVSEEAHDFITRYRAAEAERAAQERRELAEVARAIQAERIDRRRRPDRVGDEYEAARLPDNWTKRDLAPVGHDLAAGHDAALAWLMETNPGEAADFPRAARLHSSAPSVIGSR